MKIGAKWYKELPAHCGWWNLGRNLDVFQTFREPPAFRNFLMLKPSAVTWFMVTTSSRISEEFLGHTTTSDQFAL